MGTLANRLVLATLKSLLFSSNCAGCQAADGVGAGAGEGAGAGPGAGAPGAGAGAPGAGAGAGAPGAGAGGAPGAGAGAGTDESAGGSPPPPPPHAAKNTAKQSAEAVGLTLSAKELDKDAFMRSPLQKLKCFYYTAQVA